MRPWSTISSKTGNYVVELQVDEEILLDRVETRARQAKKLGQPVRADDNREALKIRLDAYYQETAPLIEYYKSKDALTNVDGLQFAMFGMPPQKCGPCQR
jgi:adenylate kinase